MKPRNPRMSENVDPTLCNKYANQDKEYIFCTKGRPFGCLVSPHLPTPTSSLIDYNLVRDVGGIKMSDLQYTKLSFGGQKFRILGKISITVQTIHGGLASGNFHLKANVVLDLMKNLDVECVAGAKLKKQLQRGDSDSDCSASDKSAPGLCADDLSSCSSSPSSSPGASPPATPPRAAAAPSPTPRPSSPPGFPVQPQYRNTVPKQPAQQQQKSRRPEIHVSMLTNLANPTVRACNLQALEDTFHNADIMSGVNRELRALHEADPDGRVSVDDNQIMTFVTTSGLRYEMGHGRSRCYPERCKERTPDTVPNNCGFNKQWLIPYGFTICGDYCHGAFCECVNSY